MLGFAGTTFGGLDVAQGEDGQLILQWLLSYHCF